MDVTIFFTGAHPNLFAIIFYVKKLRKNTKRGHICDCIDKSRLPLSFTVNNNNTVQLTF